MNTEKIHEEVKQETINQETDNQQENSDMSAQEQNKTADNIDEKTAEDAPKKSKSFFGSKKQKDNLSEINKKLTEDLSVANAKIEELQDKFMRQVAEFSNYKKRTAKEKIELREMVKSSMLADLLPVIDDFDRAIENLSTSDVQATVDGVNLIFNKFKEYLRSQELTEIQALGESFDTDFHEAVTQFPVEEEEKKGKVIDVIQKGYKINDKVIRFSKVVVGQ